MTNDLHGRDQYVRSAGRCGTRTHVRDLLVTAEQAGLVRLHAPGGRRVEILPRLWSCHDRAIAAGMYGHDLVYLATLRAIDATADVPLVPQLIGPHNVTRPAAGFERGSLAI
jgi:hypothetical protein